MVIPMTNAKGNVSISGFSEGFAVVHAFNYRQDTGVFGHFSVFCFLFLVFFVLFFFCFVFELFICLLSFYIVLFCFVLFC